MTSWETLVNVLCFLNCISPYGRCCMYLTYMHEQPTAQKWWFYDAELYSYCLAIGWEHFNEEFWYPVNSSTYEMYSTVYCTSVNPNF